MQERFYQIIETGCIICVVMADEPLSYLNTYAGRWDTQAGLIYRLTAQSIKLSNTESVHSIKVTLISIYTFRSNNKDPFPR